MVSTARDDRDEIRKAVASVKDTADRCDARSDNNESQIKELSLHTSYLTNTVQQLRDENTKLRKDYSKLDKEHNKLQDDYTNLLNVQTNHTEDLAVHGKDIKRIEERYGDFPFLADEKTRKVRRTCIEHASTLHNTKPSTLQVQISGSKRPPASKRFNCLQKRGYKINVRCNISKYFECLFFVFLCFFTEKHGFYKIEPDFSFSSQLHCGGFSSRSGPLH